MNFRYDINGLRAFAVIAVVLFHFNPAWVPGGFAGVDVFFVISGFLMTGIIFRGLENDNFNLFKFYVARANRIIPALAVLCIVLLAFGWFYFTPLDYKALGKHVASSMGFLSNVIYWRESGYFDAASYEKWLLHTWSLSVEWQFYIIYPIVLVVLKRFLSLDNLKRLIVIGGVLGFAFSVVATIKWANAAYYLLPTRAWELMMGGVAFLYPWNISNTKKKVLEIVGLLFILGSYIFVSSNVPWPGYFALIPVLGSYLMIVSNQQSSIITNNKIFQSLGKWSYSIYLWHWPVVVLGLYFDIHNWYLYGLPLSVVLGFASYRFIEGLRFNPFERWLDFLKVKPVIIAIILSTLGFWIFKYTYFIRDIPKDVYSGMIVNESTNGNGKYTWERVKNLSKKTSFDQSKLKVLFIGDSQVGDFINALDNLDLNHDMDMISRIIQARCEVFFLEENDLSESLKINVSIKKARTEEQCIKDISSLIKDPVIEDADVIFIAMFWKDRNLPFVFKSIKNIIDKNSLADVYVVGGKSIRNVPELIYESYSDRVDLKKLSFNNVGDSHANTLLQSKNFKQNEKKYSYNFISIIDYFCTNQQCEVTNNKFNPYYYDTNHTTKIGSKYLSEKLKDDIPSILLNNGR